MKKILSLTLIFTLVFGLVGCGNNNSTGNKNTEDETVTITHQFGETEVAVNPKKIAVFDLGILDILDFVGIEVGALPSASLPEYLSKFDSSQYIKVGSMKEVDYDALSDYSPDLIIISGRLADAYEELSEIAPTIFFQSPGATYFETLEENVNILQKVFPDKADAFNKELTNIKRNLANLSSEAVESGLNALVLLANDGSLSVYGAGSRYGVIHDGFDFVEADDTIVSSTHGQEASFEYIVEVNPDILFVVDRSAAIGSDGATGAATLLDNDLVNSTKAATNNKIVYLSSDVWYLVMGGFTGTNQMIDEVAVALD